MNRFYPARIGLVAFVYDIKFDEGVEEYLVPVSTELPSQHRSAAEYHRRHLPTLNRTRGDVGVVR